MDQEAAMAMSHRMFNTVRTAANTARVLDLSTDTYVWQDDAACAFQPPGLFEIASMGDPLAEGLTEEELRDLNNTNLLAGEKICADCPVWHLCYLSAEPSDFRFTMRAGVIPINLKIKRSATEAEREPTKPKVGRKKNDPTEPCKNGHELRHWKLRADGSGWTCYQCTRDARGYQEREKPPERCPEGHDEWSYRKDGRRWCGPCNREDNRRRYHAAKVST